MFRTRTCFSRRLPIALFSLILFIFQPQKGMQTEAVVISNINKRHAPVLCARGKGSNNSVPPVKISPIPKLANYCTIGHTLESSVSDSQLIYLTDAVHH